MRVIVILLASIVVWSGTGAAQSRGAAPQVERGKYLVEKVALCVQCHSPRGADGGLIRDRLLSGGVIPFKSPFRNDTWAVRAPALAGLPGWIDKADVVHLLRFGSRPNGQAPRAPMPPYRLNREDAEAIVAYLAALGS
jgi:mono/diheme cytochrome c family protein